LPAQSGVTAPQPDRARAASPTAGRAAARAIAWLRADLDDLVTCFGCPALERRKAVRMTDSIERRLHEVNRRTRPMDAFQDETSTKRILLVVFMHQTAARGLGSPFAHTHNP
jgi:transposase-like protein